MMKFSNLFRPTDKKLRKLGNALVGATQGIAIPAVLADLKWLAVTTLVVGWLGKFLIEMTTPDEQVFNQNTVI
jgi:hypothetical protein